MPLKDKMGFQGWKTFIFLGLMEHGKIWVLGGIHEKPICRGIAWKEGGLDSVQV